jgi:hypothetical protein
VNDELEEAIARREVARVALDWADPANEAEVDAAIHRLAAAEAEVRAVIVRARKGAA